MVNKYLFLTTIFATLIYSCSSEEITETTTEVKKTVTSLTASLGEPSTRTQYVDDYENNVLRVTWKGTDKIRVYSQGDNVGTEYSCNNQITTDGKTAVFSGNAELSGTCTAVYPSTADKNGTVDFSNQVQNGNNNTEHLAKLDVMKCDFDANNSVLVFNHQIAIMKVVLHVRSHNRTVGINSVSITGAWGTDDYSVSFTHCTLQSNNELIAYIAVPEGNIRNGHLVSKVTLNCGDILQYTSPNITNASYNVGQMYTANYYSIEPEIQKSEDCAENRGFADLGLPSGTLWSLNDWDYYYRDSYDGVRHYPDKSSYDELIEYCYYDNGFLVSTVNGKRLPVKPGPYYVSATEIGPGEYLDVTFYNPVTNSYFNEVKRYNERFGLYKLLIWD